MESGIVLSVIGAVMAALLGGVGSCIGIGAAASKGAGVLAEKPSLFGKILILSALPGSQGVYGLLIAIFILSKIGFFGTPLEVSAIAGKQFMWAGILMGLAGLASGWFQGKVVAAGVGAVARDESLSGKAIVLAVVVETYAIFGLLIALLIANAVKL